MSGGVINPESRYGQTPALEVSSVTGLPFRPAPSRRPPGEAAEAAGGPRRPRGEAVSQILPV